MSDIDWLRVAEIFGDAVELPPGERTAFVASRCAGRPDEQAAVERMLAAQQSAEPGFLDSLDASLLDVVAQAAAVPMERIGPWRLVREIGRGGMGEVFLGERADGQFEQQVAIKLLKRGMDSDAILARFLRERQILAGLDHPNVARLFDGGIADDGRPYFVMEHVDGEAITDFADGRRLTVDERLEVFRDVCLAVEYAHRNLVVHRDLKPSNILVTRDGRPKLLDFGVAKLLAPDSDASDHAQLTVDGARLMTPAYAAPEQFRGGAVTTSADVYGLGAVLFELLSGRRPYAADADRFQMPPDTEPVTLSTVVQRTRTGDDAAVSAETIAAARSTDVVRLRRRLAGDLETIVATALRAQPERRYASVGALQEDLQRHRERLPVRARADTLAYRASRFVRRNRWGVAASVSIAALVLAFGITANVQARALAVERDRAHREAAAAREVSEFLVGVFEVADPDLPGHGDSISATDLLDRGAARIESDLAAQPDIQGRLLSVLGRAYSNLQRSDRAEPLLARALELQRATAGAESPTAVSAQQQLARVHANQGDFQAAIAMLREAIAVQERIQPVSATMLSLHVDLAYMFHGTGDYERGRAAADDAITLFSRLSADELGDSRSALLRMADLMRFSRDASARDSVFVRLLEIERAAAGERSALVANVYLLWGRAYGPLGDLAATDSLLTLAADIHRAIDPTSTALASATAELAGVAVQRGHPARADTLARTAIEIFSSRFGADARQVIFAQATRAEALYRLGRFEESIALRRLSNAVLDRYPDDAAMLLPQWRTRLAVTLHAAGRLADAIAEFEQARRAFEERYPADYLLTANLRRDYGDALVDAGRAAEAEPMLQQAIAVLSTRWGEHDYRVDAARVSLGRAFSSLRRFDEADRELRGAHARLLDGRGTDDAVTKRARNAIDQLERTRTH